MYAQACVCLCVCASMRGCRGVQILVDFSAAMSVFIYLVHKKTYGSSVSATKMSTTDQR